jgi:hypothetical protein
LPPGIGYSPLENNGVWGQHLFHLLPHLEQANLYARSRGMVTLASGAVTLFFPGNNDVYREPLSTFICPSDPSVDAGGFVTIDGVTWGASCYAVNSQVVAKKTGGPQGKARMPADFVDGLSNTLLYVEKFARCSRDDLPPAVGAGGNLWAYCASKELDMPAPMQAPHKPFHASIAINGYMGLTTSIGPESIFQIDPNPFVGNCDPTRAYTPHISGMQAAMADGSVRTLAPSLSGDAWWAAMTPEGEEAAGSEL